MTSQAWNLRKTNVYSQESAKIYLNVYYVFPTTLVELYLTAPLKVSILAILRMPGYEVEVEGFW